MKPLRCCERFVLISTDKVDNPTNVMGATNHARRFWSFDDPVIAELARTDPSALIGGATGLTVIDEVQSD